MFLFVAAFCKLVEACPETALTTQRLFHPHHCHHNHCHPHPHGAHKDTPTSLRSPLLTTKPNCLWYGPMEEHVTAVITEFKLHAFSLVQTTIGFDKPCHTGSPVYHVV